MFVSLLYFVTFCIHIYRVLRPIHYFVKSTKFNEIYIMILCLTCMYNTRFDAFDVIFYSGINKKGRQIYYNVLLYVRIV